MDGLQGWNNSSNFKPLLNFKQQLLYLIATTVNGIIYLMLNNRFYSCRFLSKFLIILALPQGITSLTLTIKYFKGALLYSANLLRKFSIVVSAVRVRGSVLCCVAHYASVMTRNSSESHTSLWRKVTLIKPHLMIELIKSATLFLSLSVFVCV